MSDLRLWTSDFSRRHPLSLLHRDGASRASNGAQTATDATGFVLDDPRLFASLRQLAISGDEGRLQLFVPAHRQHIHQAQTILRANVRTPAAQDALVPVKNRAHVAFQTSQALDRKSTR